MNIERHDLRNAKRTSTPHIELRLGKVEDVERIADLLGRFFALTIWAQHMTFNRPGALEYLRFAIPAGYSPHVLALDEGELVGICSYHIYRAYTDKPIAVMDETFVEPRLKRTDLGRRLVGLAIELARSDGCKVFNFPIASGMSAQNSLMNMVGRHFGADYVGTIFRKVL
jgi:GNAT superfamily N-acetyltransferase